MKAIFGHQSIVKLDSFREYPTEDWGNCPDCLARPEFSFALVQISLILDQISLGQRNGPRLTRPAQGPAYIFSIHNDPGPDYLG